MAAQAAELTPENAAPARRVRDSPAALAADRAQPADYLGAVRAYLTWLQEAGTDGDPLNNADRFLFAGLPGEPDHHGRGHARTRLTTTLKVPMR
jgi:hypothetical protein